VIAHRRSLLHGIVLDAKKQGFVCAAAKEHFFHADGNVLKMANSSASLPISWYIHQPTLIEAI
jgi:hypothetical protein